MKPIIELPLIGKVPSYSMFAILGMLITSLVALYYVHKKGYDIKKFNINHLISFIGLLIGMKLFGMISVLLDNIWNEHTIHVKQIIDSGIVFYGGMIGYYIVFRRLERKKKNEFIFDILAFCYPLFGVFGRIGCFLGGCCYGIQSNSILAISYHRVMWNETTTRIPVQLWEAMADIIIFIIIKVLYKKELMQGKLIYLYFIIYGVIRFILEFFRGDDIRGVYGFISFSQIISILIVTYGIYQLNKRKGNRNVKLFKKSN